MSSAMDLDASLDDIIKKKRPSNQHKKGNKQQQQQHQQQQQQQQKQQSKNQKSTKSSQNKGKQQQQQQPQKQVGKKSGILGRLGPNGVHQQSKVNMKQPQRLQLTTASLRSKGRNAAFPKAISKLSSTTSTSTITTPTPTPKASNIVITKQVSGRNAYDGHPQQHPAFERYQPPQQQQLLMEQPIRQETSFSIRGMSAPSGISIRGESGPASVLISNLDREANSDDVRTACSQFGEVIGCEVFYDRTGRSVGEAEVEFATKVAALDCIAKLDNESADGQILRVILRERPVNKYYNKPQETRPVMASTISYPASGKMYADQIETSRYGVSTRRY